MPAKVQSQIIRVATELAQDGWTRDKVARFIAKVEEDGVASPEERRAVDAVLATNGWLGRLRRAAAGDHNFLGHSEARLRAYDQYLDKVRPSVAPQRVALLGRFDVDAARYRRNVEILAGERATQVTDAEGRARRVTFRDRYIDSPKNQLSDVVSWLCARYDELGLACELQPVPFRGRTLYNVVVTIPGASPDAVVLADHYDSADKEEGVPANKIQLTRDHGLSTERVRELEGSVAIGGASPGADDNASATAALLEAGRIISQALAAGAKLEKTIKLAHLVGEEMPGDCIGGRTFAALAKERGETIAAAIVLDMIGVDRKRRRKVQVSVGRNPASLDIAAAVKNTIADAKLDLKPVLRPFGARKSFLHQTDALSFSRLGFPVALLNEHLNDDRDLFRVGYHDEFDTTDLMSFSFATDVTRAAIESVYRLAGGTALVRG